MQKTTNPKQEFLKIFNAFGYKYDRYELFSDFLEMTASALSLPFYTEQVKERFERVMKKYEKAEIENFEKMIDFMIADMEMHYHDFIGEIFGELELGNDKAGQFFTPYSISQTMAKITVGNIKEQFEHETIITVCEPASGSGGMVIALAEEVREQGVNYQECIYVEATDIDYRCFLMTYIQLSLYGIPAKVIFGDTIAMTQNETRYTSMYFIKNIKAKLFMRELRNLTELNPIDEVQEAKVAREQSKPSVELPKDKKEFYEQLSFDF